MTANVKNTPTTDIGLLILRIMLAAVFIFHGSQKLFSAFGGHGIEGFAGFLGQMGVPLPTVSAYLAASAEFFGGMALLTGLGLRIAVVPMIFTMLVASFAAHGAAFDMQKGGMEYPLTLAAVLTALGFTGPGRFSLSGVWRLLLNKNSNKEAEEIPVPRKQELA